MISIELLRRGGLGLALGILLIIPLSFMIGGGEKMPHDLVFDSEILELPQMEIIKKKPQDDSPRVHTGDTDSDYPFFAKNRAGLTEAQNQAITEGRPTLSIILTGVGGQKSLTEHLIKTMPHDVTVSVAPYIQNHRDVMDSLHSHGYEIWMDLAAVTLDMNHDYGPYALNPTLDFERNIDFLAQQFGQKDFITGLLLPQRSLIIETSKLWDNLVADIYEQGYGIIDNTRQVTRPSLYFHHDKKAPYIKTDKPLEKNLSIDDFKAQLDLIAQQIEVNQQSLIVTIPVSSPAMLDILSQWIDSLRQKKMTIIPASAQTKL